MRALVCREFGPPETLKVEIVADPVAGPGQVLVAIEAACVNFTDVLSTGGRSQLARDFPMIPGVEAAGTVLALGEGTTGFALGDRVLCQLMCGGFAELVAVDSDAVARIPNAMTMDDAAAFYIAAFTTWHALVTRARLTEGESLLVLGAGGGAGLAAVQMGRALGARVVAAASSESKLALARDAGADATLLYARGQLDLAAQKGLALQLLESAASRRRVTIGTINAVRDAAGFDVIYDGVGGSYAEPAIRALAWEGRYLSVGFAAGMPKVALGPLLFKNASLYGIQPSEPELRLPGRTPAALRQLFAWYEQGLLHPIITERYDLAQAGAALRRLLDREAEGRIIVTMR
ncbi:NADPH:quinone oxidoreductase family protein [Novosphingobium lentum]|uniref:NADPH:quinone oxidoreductase family protein n=1 Tax=Novosphingobium lentum TaxID=145287 RepID=UPI00082FAE96|nr:NADPH:quinone oxidoreductase family protein [Novosphingobium lentum]